MNVQGTPAQKYDRAAYRPEYGFWADFIHPTAMAEGALFHTLNTYDRARFTFSFLQFAAHVPDGDFVRYFRALLKLPLAVEYFPDLRLTDDGRIVRDTDEGTVRLETSTSTDPLMRFLNPSLSAVEDTEVIQAAKFIHWVQNDPDHRRTQVNLGVENFRAKMAEYARRYDLDGARDAVCLVVADIRHQGRAKSPAIVAALQSADPLNALLAIGATQYRDRIRTLKQEIKRLTDEGTLGTRKYSLSKKDFV